MVLFKLRSRTGRSHAFLGLITQAVEEGDTGISCAGVVQQEQRQLRIHTYRTCTIINAPPTLRELLPSRMKLARGPIVTREAMDTRLDEDEAKF